jgi:hypothetical protein
VAAIELDTGERVVAVATGTWVGIGIGIGQISSWSIGGSVG